MLRNFEVFNRSKDKIWLLRIYYISYILEIIGVKFVLKSLYNDSLIFLMKMY